MNNWIKQQQRMLTKWRNSVAEYQQHIYTKADIGIPEPFLTMSQFTFSLHDEKAYLLEYEENFQTEIAYAEAEAWRLYYHSEGELAEAHVQELYAEYAHFQQLKQEWTHGDYKQKCIDTFLDSVEVFEKNVEYFMILCEQELTMLEELSCVNIFAKPTNISALPDLHMLFSTTCLDEWMLRPQQRLLPIYMQYCNNSDCQPS